MTRLRWRRMILVALVVCGLCLPSGAFAFLSTDRGLYAVDDGTDSLYRVDADTGAATLVGALGENASFSGMAYDTSTNTMYISDIATATGFALGTLNLTTGAVTIIGDHVNSIDIMGLAYDSVNDVLYGADIDASGLATINRSTGESTVVGSFVNSTQIRGLAYCPANDTLYGIDSTNIFTIDRSTGEATVLGAHGLLVSTSMGLSYDENSGALFASGQNDPNLYRIDMVSGVAGPSIGATGIDISSLASVPAQGALSVLYVETLGGDDSLFSQGLEAMDIDGLSRVDATEMTPLTAYMQTFDVVLVATSSALNDAVTLGDNLADYVDSGGAVGFLTAALDNTGGWGIDGRITGPTYSPLAGADSTFTPTVADTIVAHPITSGVTTLTVTAYIDFTAPQGSGISLGTFASGFLIGAYNPDNPVAVINVHPEDTFWTGDFILMVENMINWLNTEANPPGGGGGGGGGCFISDLAF